MPEGVRFVGPPPGREPAWRFPLDAPADEDLAACVACGLCLPHCPTYRVTGEESASPRGRITAMRSVADGLAHPDEAFARFMDRSVRGGPGSCGGSGSRSHSRARRSCGCSRRSSRSDASRSPDVSGR